MRRGQIDQVKAIQIALLGRNLQRRNEISMVLPVLRVRTLPAPHDAQWS